MTEVYTVHTVRPDDIGSIEIVFTTERDARVYARDRSTDFRVLASSVTRFTIGHLGTRHPVAWFVEGMEQSQRDPVRDLSTRPTGVPRCDRRRSLPGRFDRNGEAVSYKPWSSTTAPKTDRPGST